MKKNRVWRLLLLSIAACCMRSNAADLYVVNYAGDIQAAVDAAVSNDTVWVEDGTYMPAAEIVVTNAITVRGINGPTAVIIDGSGTHRCFNVSDVAATLTGLTLQNGYTDEGGGGVYFDSELPVISNCVIRSSVADVGNYTSGGGLSGGTAIDCRIENNEAMEGGGAVNSTLVDCRVEGNAAMVGGGLAYGWTTNCLILNNTAISAEEGEISPAGGGLYESTTFSCPISGNETSGEGGGACYGSLYNCTVTANTGELGGGVAYMNEIFNCIVWGNIMTGTDIGVPEIAGASAAPMAMGAEEYLIGNDIYATWDVNYTCVPELEVSGNGNITNNPILVSYSHIATNSPCIGAGTTNFLGGSGGPVITATDIDGESWATPPSMGCDENHGAGSLVGSVDLAMVAPELIATDHIAEFIFFADGISSLVVATFENAGSVTNPIGIVEATWSTPGTNDVILTAYNETYPSGISITQQVVVVSASASALYVSDSSGNDANDGSSWALAKQTVQAGIDAQSIMGGWVLVADGTYTNELFPVLLNAPVVLQGTNTAPTAILDAGQSGGCIVISSSGAILRGFTVQNGLSDNRGGGINCTASGAIVRDCMVRNNTADAGGGGMAGGTAINCQFIGNVASYGDGAAIYDTDAIGCLLANNRADGGGAAFQGELRNCTVVANHADHGAGGTFACTVFNSIVWHNTAEQPDNGGDMAYSDVAANVCSPDVPHGVDGNITNAPLLASISHLSAGSPCLGAGDAAYASGTDIDGQVWLNPPAIGCDEFHGTGSVTGELALAISGRTHLVVGAETEYGFIAIGPVTQTVADFGDGTMITNPIAIVSKPWNVPGTWDVVYTAWSDSYPGGTSITQQVVVLSLAAATIHVAPDGSDSNDGSSWALAKQTVQGGVDAQVFYGGRVLVSNGTYVVTNAVSIHSAMSLVGVDRDATLIDGNGTFRCLEIEHPEVRIDSLTLTNGYGTYGGGIRCTTTNPVITNCVISGCDATSRGGGAYYGTLMDCTIANNRSSYGGGLANSMAINCRIEGNEAYQAGSYDGSGGGTYYTDLFSCTLTGNSAVRYGGGTYNSDTHSCLIIDNTAYRGGGSGYGNHYNATVSSNRVTSSGSGTYNGTFRNSIIYGNFRNTSTNDIVYGSYYYTCSPGVSHGSNGNITNAPAFVNALAGDYRLTAGSPCIDAGNNPYVSVLVDLDGNARIVNTTVDMGAYEYAASGAVDSDGDGMLDADELIAGTDINDSNSFFHVESLSSAVAGTTINWSAASNRLYSVYWTADLVDQPFVPLTNGLATGSFEDTTHAGETNGFYLITVELAP